VLLSNWIPNTQTVLAISTVAGLIGGVMPWLLSPMLSIPSFDLDAARTSTGEVLTSIPPHRNGFGKVHLNLRAAPFEMDAVTAGEELPPGAPIRVVEVIDERVLLVEAIIEREQPYPKEENDEQKGGQGPTRPGADFGRGAAPR